MRDLHGKGRSNKKRAPPILYVKLGERNLTNYSFCDHYLHGLGANEEVGTLAYTKGVNIYVSPRQERYMPLDAWHAVQQAQGRGQPTLQLKEVGLNDDSVLEQEADIMGEKALEFNREI